MKGQPISVIIEKMQMKTTAKCHLGAHKGVCAGDRYPRHPLSPVIHTPLSRQWADSSLFTQGRLE